MEINVTIRNVYGEPRVYPICDISKLLARLTGNKTLTVESLKVIKALGYEINIVQENGAVDEIKNAIGG